MMNPGCRKNSAVGKKFEFYEEFWKGEGPFPILFTEPHLAKGRPYLRHDLVDQHRDPEKHLEERLLEIEPHLGLIDEAEWEMEELRALGFEPWRVALRSSDLIEYTDELQDYSMLDLATAELYLSCWNRKGVS